MFTQSELETILAATHHMIDCEMDAVNLFPDDAKMYKTEVKNWRSIKRKIRAWKSERRKRK